MTGIVSKTPSDCDPTYHFPNRKNKVHKSFIWMGYGGQAKTSIPIIRLSYSIAIFLPEIRLSLSLEFDLVRFLASMNFGYELNR